MSLLERVAYGRDVKVCPPDRLPREGETILNRVTSRSVSDYVIDENGCWVWNKQTLRGYGQTGRGKPHRMYYERAYGPLAPDFHVHHKCKNRACLNPEHLEALSMDDHFRGHALEKMGLTREQVEEVRQLAQAGELTQRQIAERYGIAQSSVCRIATDQRWVPERIQCSECGGPRHSTDGLKCRPCRSAELGSREAGER